jgi:hypothetical protein
MGRVAGRLWLEVTFMPEGGLRLGFRLWDVIQRRTQVHDFRPTLVWDALLPMTVATRLR